ncbi:hypothetical protein F0L74_29650 [Chitinophaga agrisoli]|uniref:Uncharacterized protein n=1 Tax=Chitinophaga agrisoli TaxID=2607653 RepID=A0A5B2VQ31_9BACT|nr:hypothetical protein [Chitinophaga agrisoli]KAA2240327.1 hypothetical protein F0L74_29650 [Chitinophaga agrisoli]
MNGDLYLQVGNLIITRKNGKWTARNAQKILSDDGLQVFQARFYPDGSEIYSTKRGLIMHYEDPAKDSRKYTDKDIQTLWFCKGVSSQALAARELINEVKTAATQQ